MTKERGRHDRRKHEAKGKPITGNGKTEGRKPKSSEVTQKWPNGTIMGNLTRKLWGHKG